ncbi:hypothetical protein PanWU01x14_096080, partial [Parasponia andersonii]
MEMLLNVWSWMTDAQIYQGTNQRDEILSVKKVSLIRKFPFNVKVNFAKYIDLKMPKKMINYKFKQQVLLCTETPPQAPKRNFHKRLDQMEKEQSSFFHSPKLQ